MDVQKYREFREFVLECSEQFPVVFKRGLAHVTTFTARIRSHTDSFTHFVRILYCVCNSHFNRPTRNFRFANQHRHMWQKYLLYSEWKSLQFENVLLDAFSKPFAMLFLSTYNRAYLAGKRLMFWCHTYTFHEYFFLLENSELFEQSLSNVQIKNFSSFKSCQVMCKSLAILLYTCALVLGQ